MNKLFTGAWVGIDRRVKVKGRREGGARDSVIGERSPAEGNLDFPVPRILRPSSAADDISGR